MHFVLNYIYKMSISTIKCLNPLHLTFLCRSVLIIFTDCNYSTHYYFTKHHLVVDSQSRIFTLIV